MKSSDHKRMILLLQLHTHFFNSDYEKLIHIKSEEVDELPYNIEIDFNTNIVFSLDEDDVFKNGEELRYFIVPSLEVTDKGGNVECFINLMEYPSTESCVTLDFDKINKSLTDNPIAELKCLLTNYMEDK